MDCIRFTPDLLVLSRNYESCKESRNDLAGNGCGHLYYGAKLHRLCEEIITAHNLSNFLSMFPAASILDDIAMDCLGELVVTPRGNKDILVITERYTKMV